MAFYQFKRTQVIETSLEALWDFIASPENLCKITPAKRYYYERYCFVYSSVWLAGKVVKRVH